MRDEKNLRMRLAYWRKRRAFSIRSLAKEASVSSATIVKIEKDSSYIPRSDVVRSLANALSIEVGELLVDESEEKATVPAA